MTEPLPRIGHTPGWGLDYPNDYNQPADSPYAIKALADDVDAALSAIYYRPLPYSGWRRATDHALGADSLAAVAFESEVSGIGTTPAFSHSTSLGFSVMNCLTAGMYAVEFDMNMSHATIGKESTFLFGLRRTGSQAGDHTINVGLKMLTAGYPLRLHFDMPLPFAVGDTHHCIVRPVGAAATGWTMTYARHQLTRIW